MEEKKLQYIHDDTKVEIIQDSPNSSSKNNWERKEHIEGELPNMLKNDNVVDQKIEAKYG